MNIFWLHLNTAICARYHCDKHVVKMILEYAQLLSSAHRVLDEDIVTNVDKEKLYKLSNHNHPCAIWTRQSALNYTWLYQLFVETCKEYTHRYGKIHKTETKLLDILRYCPYNIPQTENMTPAPLSIANNEIHVYTEETPNLIESYRNYYKVEKVTFAKWTKREKPNWMN